MSRVLKLFIVQQTQGGGGFALFSFLRENSYDRCKVYLASLSFPPSVPDVLKFSSLLVSVPRDLYAATQHWFLHFQRGGKWVGWVTQGRGSKEWGWGEGKTR